MHSTLVLSAGITTISPVPVSWVLRPTQVSTESECTLIHRQLTTPAVVIAAVSTFLFTILVLLSSFVTTYFVGDDDSSTYTYSFYYPVEIFRNLVKMTISILVDDRMLDDSILRQKAGNRIRQPHSPPSLLQRLFRRFLLGLPVVGAGSVAHMLMSIPLPFHWLRLRTRRTGRQSKDLMALIILAVVLAGAAR